MPFKVPIDIKIVMVDAETGLRPNDKTKKIIYESFKSNDAFIIDIEKLSNKNRLEVYDSPAQNKVLKFY